jgi:molybdate transport system substrate-binding protein
MSALGKPWSLAVVLVTLAGCGRQPEGANNPNSDATRVVAYVAASTKDAVQEVADAFAREKGVKVVLNADDSAKLTTQIAQGAPAHLFLSANEKWADFVKAEGHAAKVVPLLGNELVIVVPRGNPAGIKRPQDLTKAEVKRIAVAGPDVPAGIYARQALQKLKLWEALEQGKKIVPGENVRVTLTFVERGEAEAGLVYATDARVTNRVEQVHAFDPSLHDPIRYPLVLLKEGQQAAGARPFFELLQSPPATAVFKKHGFTVLGGK